jgi:Arc/MetJ family transcription regulator
VPHDIYAPDGLIREVHRRTIAGADITSATMPPVADAGGMMAESNMMADRDEDFNTRYASYRGWQMAIERVKPIPRTAAVLDLAGMVREAGLSTTTEAVDHMLARLLRVPLGAAERDMLIAFLDTELGTSDMARAESYLEEGLRMLVHLIMSQPEYQLG